MMRGAIFDMDGVLFDTERLHQRCWRELAKRMGVTLPDSFTAAISGTTGETMDRVLEEYYHCSHGDVLRHEQFRMMSEALSHDIPVKPGVTELLIALRRRDMLIAVASSSASSVVHGNLSRTGIDMFFDEVVGGEDVENGKPAPDIFRLAARRLGLAPEQCFVFEDSVNGVLAGNAAGCVTVMVPDLVFPSEELASTCTVVPSLLDVCDMLERM